MSSFKLGQDKQEDDISQLLLLSTDEFASGIKEMIKYVMENKEPKKKDIYTQTLSSDSTVPSLLLETNTPISLQ